jgi:hypothetical protein
MEIKHNLYRNVHSALKVHSQLILLSRITVIKTGFALVIGFINHLHVVTTINYYTITDVHTTNHSTINLLSLSAPVVTIRFLETDL